MSLIHAVSREDVEAVTEMVEGWSVYTALDYDTKTAKVEAWNRIREEIAPEARAPFGEGEKP